MDNKISSLRAQLEDELSKIKSTVDLDKVRVAYLGKRG